MSPLAQTAIFLAAAVVAVPLSKRLGLGSVLGYLAAGVVIGPQLLNVSGDVDSILHFAEYGVVLLLFIIGLELQPARLWTLRKPIVGIGGAQVLATSLLLAGAAYLFQLPWQAAALAGLGLAMSSTALALQLLGERGELDTHHGRSAFAILLFQDMAVIPVLALLPILKPGVSMSGSEVFLESSKAFLILACVVVGGRYLLRPILRMVASTRIPELFTAMTLLVVIATSLALEFAGLSLALGAFMAGVLLADSEYRHQLEAGIEPLKGLLLGLFFIAIGASVNLHLIADNPALLVLLVSGLVAVKGGVLWAIGRLSGHERGSSSALAVTLSQGGEFAFVIFTAAVAAGLMTREISQLLVLAVILSMATTPLLLLLHGRFLRPWLKSRDEPPFDTISGPANPVIIAGFGRVGQIVARILRAKKIGFTALEASAEQVDFVRKFGSTTYFGDASKIELLRAAKADKARLFVLAIEDMEHSLRTAETVRRNFPDLPIIARARNRQHTYKLMDLGITLIQRDTYLSSLNIAGHVLQELGLPEDEAARAVKQFQEHDEELLLRNYAYHDDEEKVADMIKGSAKELEQLFEQDASEDELR